MEEETELPIIACYTCAKRIGQYYKPYKQLLKQIPEEIFEKIGFGDVYPFYQDLWKQGIEDPKAFAYVTADKYYELYQKMRNQGYELTTALTEMGLNEFIGLFLRYKEEPWTDETIFPILGLSKQYQFFQEIMQREELTSEETFKRMNLSQLYPYYQRFSNPEWRALYFIGLELYKNFPQRYSSEQALNKLGLLRICCRWNLINPQRLPAGSYIMKDKIKEIQRHTGILPPIFETEMPRREVVIGSTGRKEGTKFQRLQRELRRKGYNDAAIEQVLQTLGKTREELEHTNFTLQYNPDGTIDIKLI